MDFHRILRITPFPQDAEVPAAGTRRIYLELTTFAKPTSQFLSQNNVQKSQERSMLSLQRHPFPVADMVHAGPFEMLMYRWDFREIAIRFAVDVLEDQEARFRDIVSDRRRRSENPEPVFLAEASMFTYLEGYGMLRKEKGVIRGCLRPGTDLIWIRVNHPDDQFLVMPEHVYYLGAQDPRTRVSVSEDDEETLVQGPSLELQQAHPAPERVRDNRSSSGSLREQEVARPTTSRKRKQPDTPMSCETLTYRQVRTATRTTITLDHNQWSFKGASQGEPADAPSQAAPAPPVERKAEPTTASRISAILGMVGLKWGYEGKA